ncbi:ApeA N-terminal domain 1-containing protein [Corynebacterium confusum]
MVGKKFSCTEDFEMWGSWELPGVEGSLAGVLAFDPLEGFELRTYGTFQALQGKPSQAPSDFEVIWGHVEGKIVSLLVVQMQSSTTAIGQVMTEWATYSGEYLVVGEQISGRNDPAIKSAWISVDFLDYFLGKPASTRIRSSLDSSTYQVEVQSIIGRDELESLQLDSGELVTVEVSVRPPYYEWNSEQFVTRISEKHFVRYDSVESTTIETVLKWSLEVSQFVSLAANRLSDRSEIRLNFGEGDLGWLIVPRRKDLAASQLARLYSSFVFQREVSEALPMFKSWVEFHRRNLRSLRLLTEPLVSKTQYLETAVLLSGVLAESFHNSVYDKETLSESKQAFKQLTGEEFKDGKKPYFKLRALDLYFRLGPEFRNLMLPNHETWVKGLCKVRNDLAHEALLEPANFEWAYAISRVTNTLIHALVLSHVGVSTKELVAALETSGRWRNAVLLAQRYLSED